MLLPQRAARGCGHRAAIQVDTFSISALHIAIKVPDFSNSGHKNEKVTSYLQFVAGEPVGHAARPRRVQGPSGLELEQAICELVSMALWFADDAE
eukprot:SAG31_NODE_2931_length_4898_cov_2.527818_2_plen_95_part_00